MDPGTYNTAEDPEGLARLLADVDREVCNLAAVDSAYVVKLIGVTEHPVTGHPEWIVMQLADADLDRHMVDAKPWLHALWGLLCDVLRGLVAVHALPGIYRDLKAENVGVTVNVATGAAAALLVDAGYMKRGACCCRVQYGSGQAAMYWVLLPR